MLNGGKKNKVAYLNSFKLFDMLNENLIYPLFKGETTMESALSKVTPMAQSRIDEYVALIQRENETKGQRRKVENDCPPPDAQRKRRTCFRSVMERAQP